MNLLLENHKNNGFSLVEMLVTMGLISIVGATALSLKDFVNKETDQQTNEIEMTIERLGANKVIHRDIALSELTFNFLNLPDDKGLSLFAFTPGPECRGSGCSRTKTLEIASGQIKSEPVYFILKKGKPEESLKLNIDPFSVYKTDKNFGGINWKKNIDTNLSISKTSDNYYSPWEKSRIVVLSSEMNFYDCATQSHQKNSQCLIDCEDCSKSVKRPLKFLGKVSNDETDLESLDLGKEIALKNMILSTYDLCRPNGAQTCTLKVGSASVINSSQEFYSKLPFIPGGDNSTFITPVIIVKYYIQKESPESAPKFNKLVREVATFDGKYLAFNSPKILMSGIQSLTFSRKNISSAQIEYKIKKVK